jgi:hypothetical protein
MISVRMNPGQMQFTRIPAGPSSIAAHLVAPTTACFDAL